MAVLRRPVPRFFVWVTILVAVAVVTAVAGLAWWLIALIELAAWIAVSLIERAMWRRSLAPVRAAEEMPAAPLEAPTPPAAAPPPPVAKPVETPRRWNVRSPSRTSTIPAAQVRWNVWSLEKLARANPTSEELEFVAVALREFADADGRLPADFDPLVRESFGDLLPG